ncbi:MAG TPA: hypothetical protein VGT41_02840 [Candidatus Babeliales bacterium]|nr:hypothetical protein [Candidatus Babeliales bacterium]
MHVNKKRRSGHIILFLLLCIFDQMRVSTMYAAAYYEPALRVVQTIIEYAPQAINSIIQFYSMAEKACAKHNSSALLAKTPQAKKVESSKIHAPEKHLPAQATVTSTTTPNLAKAHNNTVNLAQSAARIQAYTNHKAISLTADRAAIAQQEEHAYNAIAESYERVAQQTINQIITSLNAQIEQAAREQLYKHHCAQLAQMHALAKEDAQWYTTTATDSSLRYKPNNSNLYLGISANQNYTPAIIEVYDREWHETRTRFYTDPQYRTNTLTTTNAVISNNMQLLAGDVMQRIIALANLAYLSATTPNHQRALYELKQRLYVDFFHKDDGAICLSGISCACGAQQSALAHLQQICSQEGYEHHKQRYQNKKCTHSTTCQDLIQDGPLLSKYSWIPGSFEQKITNNAFNQVVYKMAHACAVGDLQALQTIKNQNQQVRGSHRQTIDKFYEILHAQCSQALEQQKALFQDSYGIYHFGLPEQYRDPFFTELTQQERRQLKNNPAQLKEFNDLLSIRHAYKTQTMQTAWNIADTAHPAVHRALYDLLNADVSDVPTLIDAIHTVVSDAQFSRDEPLHIKQALFLSNGILKDFAQYDRAQSLSLPKEILSTEHDATRRILNHLIFIEHNHESRVYKDAAAYGIACIERAYAMQGKITAQQYLDNAQVIYKALLSDELSEKDITDLIAQPAFSSDYYPQTEMVETAAALKIIGEGPQMSLKGIHPKVKEILDRQAAGEKYTGYAPGPDDDDDFFENLKKEYDKRGRLPGGKMYHRHRKTNLWWSKDKAEHAGTHYKVYIQQGKKLKWIFDVCAETGKVMAKHKGPVGREIFMKDLIMF